MLSPSSTSFIPKQALERSDIRPQAKPVGLMFVLALIVFFVSALVLGGALLYRSLLTAEITAPCESGEGVQRCGLRATVEREKSNIDQFTIQTLQRVDKKLGLAEGLIKNHISLLAVFDLLEANTLPTVRYQSFDYSTKSLTLDGTATSYEDIAVQTDVWNEVKKKDQIKSFIFSDLDQGETDQVIKFKLTLVINPNLVLAQNQSL